MNTYSEQKKIKLRFIGMYAVSMILIFLVVTAFWQKKSTISRDSVDESADGEAYFLQFDTVLHAKLDQVDNMYTLFLKADENDTENVNNFYTARRSMAATLDSMTEQASILASGSKKTAMETTVSRYRKSLAIRENLINQLLNTPENKRFATPLENNSTTTLPTNDPEGLKKLVREKDQMIGMLQQKMQADIKEKNELINSLQTQLKQFPASGTTNNTAATNNEWKQKYSSLKVSYDKIAESERALKNAYKTVAEDNRRLLGQLQSMKKG